MSSSTENLTTGEYIGHHLQNLTYGQHADGSWGIAHSAEEAQAMGFWAFNVDTIFWAVFVGVVFTLLFRNVAKKANSGVPTRFQSLIEMVVEERLNPFLSRGKEHRLPRSGRRCVDGAQRRKAHRLH